jgi:hypothetical protein
VQQTCLQVHAILNVLISNATFCLWTVEEALAHPYFARLHDVADEPVCPEPFSFDFEQQHFGEEQMKEMIYQEALVLNPEYA